MPVYHKDFIGKKFSRLKVLGFSHIDSGGNACWICSCSCGKITSATSSALKNKKKKSCGCLNSDKSRQRMKAIGKATKTHGNCVGRKTTRIYRIWQNMHARCERQSSPAFKWYGERGIKVCVAWRCASDFIQWSLANGYRKDLTLDRKNNRKNYMPSNCRWSTWKQQAKNKSGGKAWERD